MRSHRPTRAPRRRRRRRQPEFGRRGGKAWDASASIGAMWARTWDTCSATASAERQPTTSLIARLKPSRYGKAFRATSRLRATSKTSRYAPANYQSNFAPNRQSRGGTIVVGFRNVRPETQLMFAAGFALVRL